MSRFFKSFSARLSLRFMFIMTVSIVVLSLFIFLFIRSLVFQNRVNGLKISENKIYEVFEEYMAEAEANPSAASLGNIPEIPYFMTYIIYESETQILLATNDPFLPLLPDTNGKAKKYFEKDYFFDGDLNILYFAKTHTDNYGDFIVAVAQNMDNNESPEFFSKLPLALVFMSVPMLLLSFFISFFMVKRTIRPVVKITRAAQSVTVENLSDLLPISGTGDEIDELSKTFNSLFLRLKRDFDRERQFSSDVSHELNTPLTVISGQTGLLLRWGKDDPKQLDKSLNAIKTEAKTMQAIIANLLQMSRIESGRIKPQITEVSLKGLFSWLCEEVKAFAPNVKIAAEETDLLLKTDSEMLHQILMIIISNSVKYAGESCEISLKAYKRGGHIVLELSDDGQGFTEESLPHIFERFYRADESHTRKIAGSGLGLSIAQTLCNALNAKISARNKSPHGACFEIEF